MLKPSDLRSFIAKGVIQIVMVTPFKDNEEVDFEGLKENTQFLVEKVRGKPFILTPTGSTGEFYTLSDEEWRKVIATVIDIASGKVPIVVGCSHSGAVPAVQRAKYAQDLGADGVMIVLPYYHVPNEEGLYMFYKKIAESVDIGLAVYNNPDVSKIYMKPHVLKRLVESVNNIIFVKENTPYPPMLYQQIKAVGDKVPIIEGRGEWWWLATAAFLGAKGFTSGWANFMPGISLEILYTGLNRDLNKMRQYLEYLDPYWSFIDKMNKKYGPSTTVLPHPYIDQYMEYSVIKNTMNLLGLRGGRMRLPLTDISKEDIEELKDIVFNKLKLSPIKR
jgi:4-hydroxy-tetrahydrodipicolinate synthase